MERTAFAVFIAAVRRLFSCIKLLAVSCKCLKWSCAATSTAVFVGSAYATEEGNRVLMLTVEKIMKRQYT